MRMWTFNKVILFDDHYAFTELKVDGECVGRFKDCEEVERLVDWMNELEKREEFEKGFLTRK